MKEDRFARVKEILLAVADLGEAERAAFLDEACKDDPELRREVEAILAHENDATGVTQTGGAATSTTRLDSQPDTIGPYKILEPIGEGGMGVVYLAEQTGPVRRRVAVKVIKLGMDTKQVVARFEAERQALAMMDHPNIARVLDAGAAPDGRPYFVMEHVQGVSITDYCDRHELKMPERLKLFTQVCEAIQHAHQKGVIHRDLKPSNVLVEVLEDRPVPKVIDFGVAKAIAQRLTERTVYTEQGQLIGTPEYMSPEQAEMTGLNVDTRTDIYSLGVLLYELMVGALPFEPETLRRASYAEIQRILREVDPPRPSTKLSSLGADTDMVAKRRRTDRSSLLGQLRGDLDWITMKSLEKDRTRRYASASEFATDIRRFLNDEPVVARPPSTTYRISKYVKRNRVGVGFAATVMLALTLGLVLVTVQNAKITAARDKAELVTATLEEMLASVDPTKSGRDVTVREMLDETAKTLAEKFSDQPRIEARLRHTVGFTYYRLGEHDVAEDHLARAVELLGGDGPAALASRTQLAWVHLRQGRYDEAVALLEENLEISRSVHGEDHSRTMHVLQGLASAYNRKGRNAEAQAINEEILQWRRRVFGDEDSGTLANMNNLGVSYRDDGRLEKAEAVLQEAVEIARRARGEENFYTLVAMSNLAETYRKQGRYDEAEGLLRKTLEGQHRVLGAEHSLTLSSMNRLALVYRDQGRFEEAKSLRIETLDIQRRVLGEAHPSTLGSMESLASCYSNEGNREQSEAILQDALEISQRVNGEDHEETNDLRYSIACHAALWGSRDEAISYLQEALAHGYHGPSGCCSEPESTLDDPDLESLHGDPEFEAIVEELKRRNEEGEAQAVE